MSKFLTSLEVRELDDARWVLTLPLIYQSDLASAAFTVPAGFTTDFASVPRIPLIFEAVGDIAHTAAALHDWLYTAQPVTRAMADAMFREAAVTSGVSAWRAWVMWAGVRIGGGSHFAGDTNKAITPTN